MNEERDPFVINNPSALVGALPIFLGMISDGWYVAWGSKERMRSLGGLLMRYGNVIIIDGTMMSIMFYKDYVYTPLDQLDHYLMPHTTV